MARKSRLVRGKSMDKLLDFRQKLKELYFQYESYAAPIIKALVMLLIVIIFNIEIGYADILLKWNIVAIIVLIAALLPWQGMTILSALVALIHLFSLSWEVGIVTTLFVIIAAVLQYIFLPGFGFAIVLIPVAYFLHIPYIFPLVLGVLGGLTTFIPAGMGVFFYYLIAGVQKNASFFMRTSGESANMLDKFTQILGIFKDNQLMLVSILAFIIVTLVVYTIRKRAIDYSEYIGIAVGTILNIVIFLIAGFVSTASMPYLEIFIGSAVSFIVAGVAIIWLKAADYDHTERLQYEDDDYIYYVKAVPKIKVAVRDVKIKDINTGEEIEDDYSDIKNALEKRSRKRKE